MLACLILEPVPLIKTHTLRFIQWIWKGGSPINSCGFSQHKDSKCFIQMGIHSKKRRSTISWIWEYFVHTKQWARMWQHFRRSSMQPITFFSSSDPGKAICSDRIISDWVFLFLLFFFFVLFSPTFWHIKFITYVFRKIISPRSYKCHLHSDSEGAYSILTAADCLYWQPTALMICLLRWLRLAKEEKKILSSQSPENVKIAWLFIALGF